jgi:hypothetical protein
MRVTPFHWAAAAVALLSGCSAGGTESTITGTIDQRTFPSAVEQISVISDEGTTTVDVASDGAFTLTLAEGATYRFALGPDGSGTPLVVRSQRGRLETQVTITGGEASLDMGLVRFWGGSQGTASSDIEATPRANTTPPTTELTPPIVDDGTLIGSCVDGVVEGTSQPCASGEAEVVCPEKEHGDHPGRKGRHGKHGGKGGKKGHHGDATSIADDPSTDVSSAEPVAIPELNLPLGIGCGGCSR